MLFYTIFPLYVSFLRHLEQCNTIIERFSYAFVLFFPQLFVTLHPET